MGLVIGIISKRVGVLLNPQSLFWLFFRRVFFFNRNLVKYECCVLERHVGRKEVFFRLQERGMGFQIHNNR